MKIYASDLITALQARGVRAEVWHSGGGVFLLGIGEPGMGGEPHLSIGPSAGYDTDETDSTGGGVIRVWFDPSVELYLGPPQDDGPNTYTVHPGADLQDLVELITTDPRVKAERQPKEFTIREATGLRVSDYRWELVVADRHIETVHGLTVEDVRRLAIAVSEHRCEDAPSA